MINQKKYISTEIGEMPSDWKRMSLEDISEFITKGATPTTYGFKWEESGIPFLRSECVSENGFIENGISFISEEANNVMNRSKVQSDDILISITGNVGRVAIYPKKYESGNINQHIARVRIIKDEIVDRMFIYFQVNQPNYRNYYNGIVTGAAYPQLSLKQIRETPVFVPPLETQKRIASILSNYDDLIENNNKRIKLLEETAQNMYKEWFVNFRFPNYENTAFDKESGLPVGWRKGNIGDLCEVKSGFAFKSKDWNEVGNPVIKIKNISNNTIDIIDCDFVDDTVAKKAEKFELFEGDVLIAMTGASVGKVGMIPRNEKKIYINQRVGLFRPFSENENNVNLVFTFFMLDEGQKQVQNFAGGAAQPNISTGQISNIEINISDNETLRLFNNKTEQIFNQISLLNFQNQKLKEARDILLPRLMNRTIEV